MLPKQTEVFLWKGPRIDSDGEYFNVFRSSKICNTFFH